MLTRSLCPECYQEIPADIALGEKVWMLKECPVHGQFSTMVESDPHWYVYCRRLGCKKIYDGYFVDVTGRCNISCKYCYHPKDTGDRAVDDIMAEITEHKDLAPFILIGGEPTVHDSICDIISQASVLGPVYMCTNGIKMADPMTFDALCAAGLLRDGTVHIGLSFHPESKGADIALLETAKAKGVKIDGGLFVIDDLSQIDRALAILAQWQGTLCGVRIKAASNVWATQNAGNKIFVSDMLRYVTRTEHKVEIVKDANQKAGHCIAMVDGMAVGFVSWPDVWSIDLNEIDCPPWGRARDGKVYNFLTASIMNEKKSCES